MGALLREVESDVLINALKGIAEEQRDVFFRAMSSRAADGVKDEIAGRGRLKMSECIEAQKIIVAAARRLAAEGTIVWRGRRRRLCLRPPRQKCQNVPISAC
jgi:flagellar motor switch protein FliG